MASMIFSTFTMFVPQNVMILFLLIGCVGFFGIFLPLQERKKGGKKRSAPKPAKPPVRRQVPDRPVSRPGEVSRLEQLETLKNAGLLTQQEFEDQRQKLKK